ncbi:MAG: hypothetical protein JXA13_01935 [Anaerolineales bacterium]|nr:hypothetical protein [Anaerolineales bacterium]
MQNGRPDKTVTLLQKREETKIDILVPYFSSPISIQKDSLIIPRLFEFTQESLCQLLQICGFSNRQIDIPSKEQGNTVQRCLAIDSLVTFVRLQCLVQTYIDLQLCNMFGLLENLQKELFKQTTKNEKLL